ncbi:uncharacterized protein YgbK (DUF1537 family) [Paenibacillus taihuensis]|uniref:Uncharacterized protein YgbK (DUF1537 family) n=1 Tax=Paenibacillus taihuensis TaxID=1156355 RepID=A0A3D9S2U4_9BACL|nr:four-carbon acid sugar kinase family protein [Paenibacillus taihuensis]REE86202.1 uncharacterized protein YgbK (DUF1537 family) [Paenibacillus taihuensis]
MPIRAKWVVFDDDPTGTQNVADVPVILRSTREGFRRFMAQDRHAVYVLTNTRAMQTEEAVRYLESIVAMMDEEAVEAGVDVRYVLRGDSTLRGHIFEELEVLCRRDGKASPVALFVPAFPECGRMTVGGIHYLLQGETRVPVAETEFARDPVFGYASKTMQDWVRERGPGWTARTVVLAELRSRGAAAVRDALLLVEPYTVVVPDAETTDDIRLIAAGLDEAEKTGRQVAVRTAATFAAVRCGLAGLTLDSGSAGVGEARRLLIVCGSHTAASSRQLALLAERTGVAPIMVPTERVMEASADAEANVAALVDELAAKLRQQLENGGVALLSSERVRQEQHGTLADGAKVMHALTETVRAVAPFCDAVIAKGGITSAQVATDGLQADEAEVCGQLEAGISLWQLEARLGDGGEERRRISYAVIPGNVGDDGAMLRIAGKLKKMI